jgi:hypothetical protein
MGRSEDAVTSRSSIARLRFQSTATLNSRRYLYDVLIGQDRWYPARDALCGP